MAMALAVCSTYQRLADLNPDGVRFFMEKLLLQIYAYFDEQDLIDVTFKLSNPNVFITAHRLILAAASPYFRKLFKSEKGVCPLIEINEIDSDTFQHLIIYCYTGKTRITIDNVDQVLRAAIVLQLDDAVMNCVDFIIANMADYTLRRVYALESETKNALVSQKILEYEIRNFKELIQRTEFLSLDANKLQNILKNDDLNVTSEEEVFKAVTHWYEHDAAARKQNLPDLIGCLRLTQLDTNYITSNILPLPGCRVLALETIAWANVPSVRSTIPLIHAKPRKGQSETKNFMELIRTTEFLSLHANKLQDILKSDDLNVPSEEAAFEAVKHWYEHDATARKQYLPDLIGCLRLTQLDANYIATNILPLPGCRVLALETIMYRNVPSMRAIITLRYTKPRKGQSETLFALNLSENKGAIYQYNKIENVWKKWCHTYKDFKEICPIFMNENIILTGGFRKGYSINDVISWNCKSKKNEDLPSMGQDRSDHSVVLLNNKIYVIGGRKTSVAAVVFGEYQLKHKVLQSGEMYCASNGWLPINDMITPRYAAAAVTLNGKIYVMGGCNENPLNSVEHYDPATYSWTKCADMNEARSHSGAAVHNEKIFVVGGKNEFDCTVVERYDPLSNKWTKICSLQIGRCGLGCISFQNQLWAIGGYSKKCVSVYDDKNDVWIKKMPIISDGRYYCFTAPSALLQSE